MEQYHKLLEEIKSKGTYKAPARENMPGTTSLFGAQFRHNLQEGFPLLTTKKLSFKNIVVELIWFLKGDTNIKFLVDRGCNIWNEDAYNYYCKVFNLQNISKEHFIDFEGFVSIVKNSPNTEDLKSDVIKDYSYGDCGIQYGKLWRDFGRVFYYHTQTGEQTINGVDQLYELVLGLKKNPESRRHILTAWNPNTLNQMALNACHALVQFNCRPIPWETKLNLAKLHPNVEMENLAITEAAAGNPNYGPIPQYYLDCQMYQRSADVFLGVPFNTSSYSLLTEILAKFLNMIPGDFIHTFGDVHIYDNHKEQVEEQLSREILGLPTLEFKDEFHYMIDNCNHKELTVEESVTLFLNSIQQWDSDLFRVEGYNPHSAIKAKLSTGLK